MIGPFYGPFFGLGVTSGHAAAAQEFDASAAQRRAASARAEFQAETQRREGCGPLIDGTAVEVAEPLRIGWDADAETPE